MCRLFGFRSVIPSAVHRSLLEAENALGCQSERHPDGWGLAYYVDGAPHVLKSAKKALDDHMFHRVSGVVASETVVAHVRKATTGRVHQVNAHPFQYGRWVFAHNGEIPEFEAVRPRLWERVSKRQRSFVLGDTDSEVIFAVLLSWLEAGEALIGALAKTEQAIEEAAEGLVEPERLLLNFLVTDGRQLVATRRGKELYYSTHKSRCGERDRCSSFDRSCEAPSTGRVNHLVISSEPIGGENVWRAVDEGDAVSVDADMRLQVGPLRRAARLGVVAA